MPKRLSRPANIVVTDVSLNERRVEIPAVCPSCSADLSKPRALRAQRYVDETYVARRDPTTLIIGVEQTSRNEPFTTAVLCDACDLVLTDPGRRPTAAPPRPLTVEFHYLDADIGAHPAGDLERELWSHFTPNHPPSHIVIRLTDPEQER